MKLFLGTVACVTCWSSQTQKVLQTTEKWSLCVTGNTDWQLYGLSWFRYRGYSQTCLFVILKVNNMQKCVIFNMHKYLFIICITQSDKIVMKVQTVFAMSITIMAVRKVNDCQLTQLCCLVKNLNMHQQQTCC